MSYPIDHIEGIGDATATRLRAAGLGTTSAFLEVCGDSHGRQNVAAQTGISAKQLLKWANMADLMRVPGVGKQYAELLEAAGVDTVKELRTRNVENLTAKLKETFDGTNIARSWPGAARVTQWVDVAKKLPPAISH